MMLIKLHIKSNNLDFSGVPVVETSPFSAGDVGFIPRVSWPKNHCNKFSKGFKNGPHHSLSLSLSLSLSHTHTHTHPTHTVGEGDGGMN